MLTADHLRRRWTGIVSVLVVFALVAGIFGALALRMERHEAVLDRRGLRTTAVVVSVHQRYRLPDTATVRYQHDGMDYEADVTVDDTAEFPVASTRDVVYDPVHPRHAKPVEGWSTSYGTLTFAALLTLGVATLHSLLRATTTVRLRGLDGTGTTMRVESFRLRRWWQRWPGAGRHCGRSTPIPRASTLRSTSLSRTCRRSTPSASRSPPPSSETRCRAG